MRNMRTLIKNGMVINVFTDEIEKADVLIEDNRIIGVGDFYTDSDADRVDDVSGMYICPGFIDGHIHIESTMLTPAEFARVCLPHGTTAVVADPHEIANVCGTDGIDYMLSASEGLPLSVYIMLPSCVPATNFDESGAILSAEDLYPYYSNPRVLGLAEVMNYPGVIGGDKAVHKKLRDAVLLNKNIDGHAPMLTGRDLNTYISAGIKTDHECSEFNEAAERIRRGQWLMIRRGTAARNLEGLIDLFDEPYNRRCLLVTDDKHPADLINDGHIDAIIRRAVRLGKSPIVGIRMATIQAAECFGLKNIGAVAPGYKADLAVLSSLDDVKVDAVYCGGIKTAGNGKLLVEPSIKIDSRLDAEVRNTFNVKKLSPGDFNAPCGKCRVIKTIKGELLTEEEITEIHGISVDRDILKIAVIERHKGTGHIGVGYISGIGLKRGAIASSVSHDSHNIIVIGTNEADMAYAANRIIDMEGGCTAVADGRPLADVPLPIAGLMSDNSAEEAARLDEALRAAMRELGIPENSAPLMTMAFVSLAVIPLLKITTLGYVDVNKQERVSVDVAESDPNTAVGECV